MKKNGTWLALMGGSAAVAVMGLSQILAVGALSFAPLGPSFLASGVVATFVAATLGGFFVALVSRVPGEVSGPRTSISVIYAALCAELVIQGGPDVTAGEILASLSLAVLMMGSMQMLAGYVRLGNAMKFLPYPVNAGFVTGIGLVIVWSQLGPLLGIQGSFSKYEWSDIIQGFKPHALLIGSLTAASVWLAPMVSRRIQPLLAGLVVGTVAHHLIAQFASAESMGPTLGTIMPYAAATANARTVWDQVSQAWLLETVERVLPYAGFLALQAIMNAALVSAAVSEVTGVRSSLNRTLIVQGAGNVLCGVLAGVPIGSSPAQSMVAAKMRGMNTTVPAMSMVILLLLVLAYGPILAHVPLAVLAGLLVTAGVALIDRWARDLLSQVIRGRGAQSEIGWNLVIVVAVAAVFAFGSVPLALLVGTILAMILLAISLYSATTFDAQGGADLASTRVWPPEQDRWLAEARACVRVLRPRGGLFFGTADRLADELGDIGAQIKYCVIDFSRLTTIDATGCKLLGSSAKRLAERKITVLVAGLDIEDPRDKALIALGLVFPPPKDHWFRDLDHALERVETRIILERWPDIARNTPVDLAQSQLALGLKPDELAALRAHMTQRSLSAGAVLYERGAEASSICLIDDGLIEIRVSVKSATQDWRRLAVLGPGCIIGEVAMLTRGTRSADAVCSTPVRALELRYDALRILEREQPAVYAKILANLGVILAERLRAAAEIARGK